MTTPPTEPPTDPSTGSDPAATDPSMAAAPDPEPHTGTFDVLEQLGEGGAAVVYRARHRLMGVEVALKVLRGTLSANQREKFLQECRLHWQLADHPHVVRVYWAGAPEDGPAWLATELYTESLTDRLDADPTLGPDERQNYARDILRGLAALHGAGILHRDVKPSNVMLKDGQAALADFGLATARDDWTREVVSGSRRFLAPEVLSGGAPSTQSDVYSAALSIRDLYADQELSPTIESLLTRAASYALADRPIDGADFLSRWEQATDAAARPASNAGVEAAAGQARGPGRVARPDPETRTLDGLLEGPPSIPGESRGDQADPSWGTTDLLQAGRAPRRRTALTLFLAVFIVALGLLAVSGTWWLNREEPGPAAGAIDREDTTTTKPEDTVTEAAAARRVDNPYADLAGWYVNPEWSAKAADVPGGSAIANQPTPVWLGQIGAIEGAPDNESKGPMGLRDHLDEALRQQQDAGGGPFVFQFVTSTLPGRDCTASAGNGDPDSDQISQYESEYIDVITEILSDPAYTSLRIVTVIKVDSLPTQVTSAVQGAASSPLCKQVAREGQDGVRYAIDRYATVPNVYSYLDAGQHGWLGWDDNLDTAATLIADTVLGSESKGSGVAGFVTNVSNTSATTEPYLPFPLTEKDRSSDWLEYKRYADESTFGTALRKELIARGLSPDIGMLIDTSRNGWGGPKRPDGKGASVDERRIDRRLHS
ncbi:MAG: glycoside hydrolase family 6 protein, partial [Nocardioides sp.]